jgi:S1-C subfamily serine protease
VIILDVAVLAVLACAVWGGYRLGLVTGGTSWVFLLQGLVLASLASPFLVDGLSFNDPALRLLLGTGLFVVAGWSAQFAGRLMGGELRRRLVPPEYEQADRWAGAVAGPVTVLAVLFLIVLPAMANVPGWPSSLARRSAVGQLQAGLPHAPNTANALRRLTRPIAQPEVLTALGPAGDTSPPPTRLSLDPAVVRRVSSSTVKVEGDACFFDREGSGFAVDQDVVVTNAHVVAGQDRPVVVRPDGTRLPAVVAVYDAARDLALLRVKGLDQKPLPLGPAREGSSAAVFGHPEGTDELEVSPAAIRQHLTATIRDSESTEPARRKVFVLAAHLEPGDSGGALVTPDGEVAGVAFAISTARSGVAFAIAVDELRPLLALDRTGTADTGECS